LWNLDIRSGAVHDLGLAFARQLIRHDRSFGIPRQFADRNLAHRLASRPFDLTAINTAVHDAVAGANHVIVYDRRLVNHHVRVMTMQSVRPDVMVHEMTPRDEREVRRVQAERETVAHMMPVIAPADARRKMSARRQRRPPAISG
jgi:hypothetical protein